MYQHYPIPEAQFDNILVRQKDRILFLVNNGQYHVALLMLDLLLDLWQQHNYGYKYNEIKERISREMAQFPLLYGE